MVGVSDVTVRLLRSFHGHYLHVERQVSRLDSSAFDNVVVKDVFQLHQRKTFQSSWERAARETPLVYYAI